MDWTAIHKAFYDWAVAAMGIPVVWANQNAPRQAYPFCVLQLTEVEPVGQDRTTLAYDAVDQNYDVCVEGRRNVTLNAQVFSLCQNPAEDARFCLEALNMSLRLPSIKDALSTANISLIRSGSLLQLDRQIEGVWESRWSQDFTFSTVVEFTNKPGDPAETVGSIETVKVTDEIPDPDELITITGV